MEEEKIEEEERDRRKVEELEKVEEEIKKQMEEEEVEKTENVERTMDEEEAEETLTEDQKANAVDEDPGLLRWVFLHHHEALIVPRVSHLDVIDDE